MEFTNRLNKLYTHPLLGDLLDSGEIDFAVLDILEQLHYVFENGKGVLNPNNNDQCKEMISDELTKVGRLF